MFCPNCGREARDKAAFCAYCGVPLGGDQVARRTHANQAHAPKPQTACAPQFPYARTTYVAASKKKAPVVPIVIAVIVVVAVAAVVALFSTGVIGDASSASNSGQQEVAKSDRLPSATEVGDIVKFGAYEQDGDTSNGKEEIEWRVLDVEDGRALLLSDKVLDRVVYNSTDTDITWENCSLRSWLNNDFLTTAFGTDEQEKILSTTIKNEDNTSFGIEGGNDTVDKVFCLSLSEVNTYFEDIYSDTVAYPTQQALNNGIKNTSSHSDYANYWLRSPGQYTDYAAFVSTEGMSGGACGLPVSKGYGLHVGIRPAIWVNL